MKTVIPAGFPSEKSVLFFFFLPQSSNTFHPYTSTEKGAAKIHVTFQECNI